MPLGNNNPYNKALTRDPHKWAGPMGTNATNNADDPDGPVQIGSWKATGNIENSAPDGTAQRRANKQLRPELPKEAD